MKRAVVTGATGTIGMALIRQYIEARQEILVLCRKESINLKHIPGSEYVKVAFCDLKDLEAFQTHESYDVFYHLGWEGTTGAEREDEVLQNLNIRHTLDAVRAAARLGCKVFIGAGSQAEYGNQDGVLAPETPARPADAYGCAKLAAGIESRALCRQLGIRHIWVRIFSVYGPYDDENTMVMMTIRQLESGRKPLCTAGEQLWDYIYCDDAARALALLAETGEDAALHCLGSGAARPIKEYVNMIRDVVSPTMEPGFGDVPYSPRQHMHLCADIGSLKAATGFQPNISFHEGIGMTLRVYREEKG